MTRSIRTWDETTPPESSRTRAKLCSSARSSAIAARAHGDAGHDLADAAQDMEEGIQPADHRERDRTRAGPGTVENTTRKGWCGGIVTPQVGGGAWVVEFWDEDEERHVFSSRSGARDRVL